MSSPRPTILMYHAVCRLPDDPYKDSTSPERLEAHMRHLKRRKLRGVSMRELLRAESSGSAKGLVGLTFDDGYENFLQSALPVLERFGFSATLFVLGGALKENHWNQYANPKMRMKLLDVEGIREVAARGIEIGSHGMSHIRMSGLEPDLLEAEVSGSRRVLSELLGEEVDGFCYPYGSVDSAAIRAVRGARYAYACSIAERIERNSYDLPRIPVAERDNLPRFAAKLRLYSQYSSTKKTVRSMLGSAQS